MKSSNKILIGCLTIAMMCCGTLPSFAQTITDYCVQSMKELGGCPGDYCYWECVYEEYVKGQENTCSFQCKPKQCVWLDVKDCPEEYCEVLKDCDGKDICYAKVHRETPPQCGDIGYNGQDVECCEGLVKKCGIDVVEGKCIMSPKKSPHSVPFCVPCGNGICNQFENKCNCPEDCK